MSLLANPGYGLVKLTVSRKKVTKCRPLSLWYGVGIRAVDSPRYAESRRRTMKEATVLN